MIVTHAFLINQKKFGDGVDAPKRCITKPNLLVFSYQHCHVNAASDHCADFYLQEDLTWVGAPRHLSLTTYMYQYIEHIS